MKSLSLATLLLGGIMGGALGASVLAAGASPVRPAPFAAGVVPAQFDGPPLGGPPHGPGMPLMAMAREADTDGDGRLSQAEVDAFVQAKVALGDANGDGSLTIDEFETVWLSLVRRAMVDRFQELDEDGDGSVTPAERAERFGALVRRLDRNGDGVLSADDRPRGGRHGHGHGHGRGDDRGDDRGRGDGDRHGRGDDRGRGDGDRHGRGDGPRGDGDGRGDDRGRGDGPRGDDERRGWREGRHDMDGDRDGGWFGRGRADGNPRQADGGRDEDSRAANVGDGVAGTPPAAAGAGVDASPQVGGVQGEPGEPRSAD